jgi:prepilin signal peptidase PulO-like enzyme (type II secretory pathway)
LVIDPIAAIFGGLLALFMASLASHFGLRLADRMPGESLWPECLYCQRPARRHELVPVFGWLLRTDALTLPCPCAQQRKQWAVPAAESIGLLAGMVAGALGGLSAPTLILCLAVGLLPAIAMIDLLFGIIPDWFNLLLAALGMAWLLAGGGQLTIGLMMSGILLLLGLLMVYGYSWVRRKEMLGLGDVKFFAAAGLWLQITTLFWFLIIAGVFGVINGLLWKRLTGTEQSPFAPALCLSLLGCLLYQLLHPPVSP